MYSRRGLDRPRADRVGRATPLSQHHWSRDGAAFDPATGRWHRIAGIGSRNIGFGGAVQRVDRPPAVRRQWPAREVRDEGRTGRLPAAGRALQPGHQPVGADPAARRDGRTLSQCRRLDRPRRHPGRGRGRPQLWPPGRRRLQPGHRPLADDHAQAARRASRPARRDDRHEQPAHPVVVVAPRGPARQRGRHPVRRRRAGLERQRHLARRDRPLAAAPDGPGAAVHRDPDPGLTRPDLVWRHMRPVQLGD